MALASIEVSEGAFQKNGAVQPMTAHIAKGGPLWAKPEAIAKIVRRAADKGGPIVYAPGFWRLILWIIRALPSPVMHRTKL